MIEIKKRVFICLNCKRKIISKNTPVQCPKCKETNLQPQVVTKGK